MEGHVKERVNGGRLASLVSLCLSPVVLIWLTTVTVTAALTGRVEKKAEFLAVSLMLGFLMSVVPALPIIRRFLAGLERLDVPRETRRSGFVFLLAYCSSIAVLVSGLLGIKPLWVTSVVYALTSVCLMLVSSFLKASVHMTVLLSSATLMASVNLFFLALPLYLLAPVVAWARIKLGAHNLREVVAGSLLGLTLPAAIIALLP